MHLYAGNSRDFIQNTTRNAIAGMLQQAFFEHFHYKPSQNEVLSWQNSLLQMSNVLQVGGLLDHGILLEYQLPLSSKRLDCMVTGLDGGGKENAVIVELKQWGRVEASDAEDCVLTYVGGGYRDVLHPSSQVGQYERYLRDVHGAFVDGKVELRSCAYLHNLTHDPANEIFLPKFDALLKQFPVYGSDQQDGLVTYLRRHVGAGKGEPIRDIVIASRFLPSKKLLDHTANVIKTQSSYVLIDSQQVVFNKVLAQVKKATGARKTKRTVVLVLGGPGTGKSIIALHLLGALANEGKRVLHLTGSRAFTENLRDVVGRQAGALFGYFNFNEKNGVPPGHFDAVVLDEAHRLRASSANRFTPAHKRTGKPQIDEIVEASKVSVFFIDDLQVVRPGEVGSAQLIRDTAKKFEADLFEYELEAQFRCSGSEGFINWIDNTLGIRSTANVLWKSSDPYEFKVLESVQSLEAAIREKNILGNQTARLAAGFCWPWSNANVDGSLVNDVVVGDWRMPWNARPESKRLATGIPKANFWASHAGGVDQVGCIYTAQGFEYDYAGVVFGLDLRYDLDKSVWVGDPAKSHDITVKRGGSAFTDLVKNTYRVLLTRGIKGCYVYFMDADTRRFFQSRMEPPTAFG